YVDDDYSFEPENNTEFYEPYGALLPAGQARLLRLWDDLGIPHERSKQLHNYVLPIIGFDIDPNAMTVTLPSESRDKFLAALDDFCNILPGHRRRTLGEFQSFAGYANWTFNVYPLLKPGLASLYDKMAGKTHKHAGIYINASIVHDLRWMSQHIRNSSGVHFLEASSW
ncbi:hypothetical protein C2E23DRAFT_715037, partial [Lenzites betulinus]